MIRAGLRYFSYAVGTLLLVVVIVVLLTQQFADGPVEFLQGGSFSSGELVSEPVQDWSFAAGKNVEFELVGYGTSRTAGYIVHDGQAYMTCDLGYMWNRFEGSQRWILNLIYVFKHWHRDAEEDGRALIRYDGKLYKTEFVRVQDPALEEVLRAKLEDLAREFVAPAKLGPPPAEEPNDIWFFRMDPRV